MMKATHLQSDKTAWCAYRLWDPMPYTHVQCQGQGASVDTLGTTATDIVSS